MKKTLTLLLVAAMLLGIASCATAQTEMNALDAFEQITGQSLTANTDDFTWVKTNAQYLDEIMNGAYSATFTDVVSAAPLAAMLNTLSAISNQDIENYAYEKALPVAQVRNAYYRALANVLEAEILVNPASDEQYKNLQVILSLFLSNDDDATSEATRTTIRKSMTRDYARAIAKDYGLPTDFVAFVIMDDDWNDDDWNNDADWTATAGWTPTYEDSVNAVDYTDTLYQDSDLDLMIGDRDSASSTRVAELQKQLIDLGYLSGKADGIFGPKTQAALIEFQMANGMTGSGVYDDSAEVKIASGNVVLRSDYVESYYADTDDYADSVSYNDSYSNSVKYDNTYDDSDSKPAATKKPTATKKPSYKDSYESSYENSYESSYENS